MFAIAFDLIIEETQARHPKSVPAAYSDIARVLRGYGFEGIQGSVYVTSNEDLANLMLAISALKALSWFPQSVRDIRAFRIEMWSDLTDFVKRQ
jgi:virulence-associated protein VapD